MCRESMSIDPLCLKWLGGGGVGLPWVCLLFSRMFWHHLVSYLCLCKQNNRYSGPLSKASNLNCSSIPAQATVLVLSG